MPDYKASYLREKKARKIAEASLEDTSRELYLANEKLKNQYEKMANKFNQNSLFLQISRYSQEPCKLSEVLPEIIQSMLFLAELPFGIFDYFPLDRSRENYRSPIFVNNNLPATRKIGERFDGVLVDELLDDAIVDVLYERKEKYITGAIDKTHGEAKEIMQQFNIEGVMVIPVMANSHAAAIIYLFTNTKDINISEHLKLFSNSMKQLGHLIEHRYNEEQQDRNYRQLQATVSELNLMQKQLVQSEKMASIGQLSSGIAHEINNPMGYVKSNINSLKKYHLIYTQMLHLVGDIMQKSDSQGNDISTLRKFWKSNDITYLLTDTDALLEETQHGVSRVISIVSGLKSFARASDETWSLFDLNTLVKEALKLSHNELKYKATVTLSLVEHAPVNGNSGEITQVLLNLLINAAQSIEKNGTVNVSTKVINDRVEVSITDTGKGIESENLKYIFDPFFTTKAVGEGTGLGLSISFGIIENHLGSIDVFSAVSKGTTFVVSLPLAMNYENA